MKRDTKTTVTETVKVEDTYYRLSISKTNDEITSVSIYGIQGSIERLLSITCGFNGKSKYAMEAKVEELRDLLDVALSEIRGS